jgi:hypothetical protein
LAKAFRALVDALDGRDYLVADRASGCESATWRQSPADSKRSPSSVSSTGTRDERVALRVLLALTTCFRPAAQRSMGVSGAVDAQD